MRAVRPAAGARLSDVLFWFLGAGIVAVWNVFHDPSFDYRLLAVGLLLPDIVDAPLGGARALHALPTSVAVLLVIVAATGRRRRLRRRLLAIPIGMFLHLVADGVFGNTRVFWWPFSGLSLPDARLPSLSRPILVDVALELAGVAMLWWAWRRFGLDRAENRRMLWTTGALSAAPQRRGATC